MQLEFIPDQDALDSFFAAEASCEDDVRIYAATDESGIELRFSYNLCDNSIQTWLGRGGVCLAVVCNERLARMWLYRDTLQAECDYEGGRVRLVLTIRPRIEVQWHGLEVRKG